VSLRGFASETAFTRAVYADEANRSGHESSSSIAEFRGFPEFARRQLGALDE
jgi:hypothetical protein